MGWIPLDSTRVDLEANKRVDDEFRASLEHRWCNDKLSSGLQGRLTMRWIPSSYTRVDMLVRQI